MNRRPRPLSASGYAWPSPSFCPSVRPFSRRFDRTRSKENWALETWSYEDAVAANNMIRAAEAEAEAAASYEAASYEYGGHRDHGQCAERTSTASDDSCRIECKMHGEEQGHGVEKGWAPELCGRTR